MIKEGNLNKVAVQNKFFPPIQNSLSYLIAVFQKTFN